MAKWDRPPREAPKSGAKGKNQPKEKHLVQESGKYNCVLHRYGEYRENARAVLKAAEGYDAVDQIKIGIGEMPSTKKVEKEKGAAAKDDLIEKRLPLYKFEGKHKNKVLSFASSYVPYKNEAHHILVCELFYDDYGWDADHLDVLKQTVYNINNPHNIIYLPLRDGDVNFHKLPNHKNRHLQYSEKQLTEHVDAIYDMVDQVWNEAQGKKCDPVALKSIYDELIKIEDAYWKYLVNREPKSMA